MKRLHDSTALWVAGVVAIKIVREFGVARLRSRGMTALGRGSKRSRYFTAPKRLSNEFGGTIGAEPAT